MAKHAGLAGLFALSVWVTSGSAWGQAALSVGDDRWSLALGGYAQLVGRSIQVEPGREQSSVYFQRLRPEIRGHLVAPWVSYRLQLELGYGTTSTDKVFGAPATGAEPTLFLGPLDALFDGSQPNPRAGDLATGMLLDAYVDLAPTREL